MKRQQYTSYNAQSFGQRRRLLPRMRLTFSENLFDFASPVMPTLFYETVVQADHLDLVIGFDRRFVGSGGRQIYLPFGTE